MKEFTTELMQNIPPSLINSKDSLKAEIDCCYHVYLKLAILSEI